MASFIESSERALDEARAVLEKSDGRVKRKKPKLIITVEIGDGRVGDIPFCEGDAPGELAKSFCKRYDLPPAVIGALTHHIETSVTNLRSKQEKSQRENAKPRDVRNGQTLRTQKIVPGTSTVSRATAKPKTAKNDAAKAQANKTNEKEQPPKNKGGGGKKRVTGKKMAKKTSAPKQDVYTRLFSDGSEKRNKLDKRAEDAERERRNEHARFSFKPSIEPDTTGWERGAVGMKKYFSDMGFDDYGFRERNRDRASESDDGKSMSIHNRLYLEGLHETKAKLEAASRKKESFDRKSETWSCPRCCHLNEGADSVCMNHVKNGKKKVPVNTRDEDVWLGNGGGIDRHNFSEFGGRSGGPVDASRKVVQEHVWQCCGCPRPAKFKPVVSKMAHRLVRTARGFEYSGSPNNANQHQRSKLRVGETQVFEALYNPKALSRKVITLAQQQEEKEMKECTFKPTISKRSADIVRQKQGAYYEGFPAHEIAESKCERLYMDAKERRERQDKYIAQEVKRHPFKPDIGVNKIRVAGGKAEGSNFFQRLHKSGDKKFKDLEMLKKSARFDNKTGQPLFHPKVGRPPHFDRNSQGLPVHEFLFKTRQEYEDKIRVMAHEQELEREMMQNHQYISKGSSKLLEDMKLKRFRGMFDNLVRSTRAKADANAPVPIDATLDTSKADVNVLEEWTREIVRPVLIDFENHGLNFKEFSTLMIALLNDPGNGPINSILATRRTKAAVLEETAEKIKAEETFHPQINRMSQDLAANRTSSSQPIFEVLSKERKRFRMNMDAERQRLEEEEMVECTFKPKLVSRQAQDVTSVYAGM